MRSDPVDRAVEAVFRQRMGRRPRWNIGSHDQPALAEIRREVARPLLAMAAVTDLVEALEEIVRIYEDDDLSNSAAQDDTHGVARAALASYRRETGA